MSDQESDPEAVLEALEVVGSDVFALLADASQRYGVVISVHIAPNAETSGATQDLE